MVSGSIAKTLVKKGVPDLLNIKGPKSPHPALDAILGQPQQKVKSLKIIKGASYQLTDNYGPLKKGTLLKVVETTTDSYVVSWRGRAIHIPACLVGLEQKRTYKERRSQDEYTRN